MLVRAAELQGVKDSQKKSFMRTEGGTPETQGFHCRKSSFLARDLLCPWLCSYRHGLITAKAGMGGTPRRRNQVRKAAVIKRRELDEPFQVPQKHSPLIAPVKQKSPI